MWWILARIAGWDGKILVTDISVTSAEGLTEIPTGSTLQFSKEVLPKNATDTSVIWSVENQTGQATITQGGLLNAVSGGTVMVKTMAADSSGVADSLMITITVPDILIDSILIEPEGSVTDIYTGMSHQFFAEILPEDATVKSVVWQVENLTGEANITQEGLLNTVSEGIVRVKATARDGSGVADSMEVNISVPEILVDSIHIVSEGGITEIITGMPHQFTAEVLPEDATVKSVVWQVKNLTGEANITQEGLLNTISKGTIWVKSTASDGSGIADSILITISDQKILVDSITISSAGGVTEISTGMTLQFTAEILPQDATVQTVEWQVENLTGEANISGDGLLTAISAGSVAVYVIAGDGSGTRDSMQISIEESLILANQILITSEGGVIEIDTDETLQFHAEVLPENASNKTIAWSVENETGAASISQEGMLTPNSPGTVSIIAIALDGSGLTSSFSLTIKEPLTDISRQKSTDISIYPNPGQGVFYINPGDDQIDLIQVIGICGTVSMSLEPEPGLKAIPLDLSSHQPGYYFIRIYTDLHPIVKQISKLK